MKSKARRPHPFLVVSHEDGKSRRFPIKRREVTVGRDPANDICINDPLVSKFHAKLLVANQSVTVIDLESANKTRLNGQVVSQATVCYGDELQFARVKSQLILPESEPESERSSKIG